ncbi:MAG TPA: DUF2357 domain-containing protein, partial [Clostridiales bacterium]|nr:DUF2357 domain-containing protein [Clostridiales bacterium]
MGKSLETLYAEYKQNILSLTAGNEFYEHLNDVAEHGKNSFSLFNRFFEKTIDMRWVDAIERCIIPLDTIVRNPRKFIIQEEEIVPIERAKKITAESVRHLAQHTNLIARVDDDNVTPSQILNVFREESFEIYENRFIFTLLKNLQRFIEVRYNVIFNLANDETMASMKMESELQNGREKIIYKLEIASQSSNEAGGGTDENKDALIRIERIKRIINEFAHSSFMNDLQNCTPVRPPIMRTNVIAKDPNFQACLALWQFISSYDEVGYEIISKETNGMVSDEYRDDLYKVLSLNYLLLKNNAITEKEVTTRLRNRRIKPKIIRRFAEELVMDYDIEEVEIRRIFVDELKRAAKKRLAGEEKVRAAIARALASEAARKAARREKELQAIQRKKEIERQRKQREAERAAKRRALEKERREKERARLKAKREKEAALAKAKAEKERERLRLIKQRELEAKRAEKEKLKKQALKEKERAAKLKAAEAEKARQAALAEKQRKQKALEQAAAEKEKEKQALRKQKENEARARAQRLAREKAAIRKAKEKEKARLEQIRLAQLEKAAAIKQQMKERAAAEKAAQKALEREKALKAKEKQRAEKEKEAQLAREKAAALKAKEKERAAREKAAQLAREKEASAKAKEKQRAEKAKEAQLARE